MLVLIYIRINILPAGFLINFLGCTKLAQFKLDVYRYIRSAKYRLPIWQNLQYWKSVFFNCTDITTDIFTCTDNLMHCLVVTISCCVVQVLLLCFAVNFVVSYVQYLGKSACHVCILDRLSISASFQ